MSIKRKLLSTYLLLTIVGLSSLLLISYFLGKSVIEEQYFEHLKSVRENKSNQIERYFKEKFEEITFFSTSPSMIKASGDFIRSFEELDSLGDYKSEMLKDFYDSIFLPRLNSGGFNFTRGNEIEPKSSEAAYLQDCYIASNPYELGSFDSLVRSQKSEALYHNIHEIYHPYFKEITDNFGYYDLFIVDNNGNIVYSVFKEIDFATNLLDGPHKESGLAASFRKTLKKGQITVTDFTEYLPSYNAPAGFIATPIIDGDATVGVLAVQIPIDQIEMVMTGNYEWENEGLGSSGETYLVGADLKMRNNSRFFIQDQENYFNQIRSVTDKDVISKMDVFNTTILQATVNTPGVRKALQGQQGNEIITDYRGVEVFSSFKPLNIDGLDWVILSEVDRSEAMKGIYKYAIYAISLFLIIVFLTAIISYFLAKRLTRPIISLTDFTRRISNDFYADGLELDAIAPIVNRTDEIGGLGTSFKILHKNLLKSLGERDLANKELENLNKNLEKIVEERTKELNKTSEKLSMIIETSADGIITIDEEYKIILFNPAAQEVFGYTQEEILGKPISVLIPEEFHIAHDKHLEDFKKSKLVSKQMGHRSTLLGKRKNGETFPLEAGISKYVQDEKIYYTAVARDVTLQKEMERLIKESKERMEKELNIARDIQMSMLPLTFPAFPERPEFDVMAKIKPAREVGGDFYDFYFVDENRFCFVIGDVSGKGVPAALEMAVTKTLISSRAENDLSTASIFTNVNDEISRNNPNYMFITLFIGILNLSSGELIYSNAGHNPPFIKRADGSLVKLDELHGPVVGALEGFTYGQSTLALEYGDLLFMYTDGVTEASNTKGEFFGESRLMDFLSGSHKSLTQLIDDLIKRIETFEAGVEQADDITTLVFRITSNFDTIESNSVSVEIENRKEQLALLKEKLTDFGVENELESGFLSKLIIVVDELITNIIDYGFDDAELHRIRMELFCNGEKFVITIMDDGVPFNPFNVSAPDLSKSLEDSTPGGLGIHLVKNLMNDFKYRRSIGKNISTLIKYRS